MITNNLQSMDSTYSKSEVIKSFYAWINNVYTWGFLYEEGHDIYNWAYRSIRFSVHTRDYLPEGMLQMYHWDGQRSSMYFKCILKQTLLFQRTSRKFLLSCPSQRYKWIVFTLCIQQVTISKKKINVHKGVGVTIIL